MTLIKEMCQKKNFESTQWIETKDKLAGSLTKKGACSEKFQNVLQKGELHIKMA